MSLERGRAMRLSSHRCQWRRRDLTQEFYVYEGRDYVLTDVVLKGDASLRSNYLAPVAVATPYDLYAPAQTNRMLKCLSTMTVSYVTIRTV